MQIGTNVRPLRPLEPLPLSHPLGPKGAANSESFAQLLFDQVQQVNQMQHQADASVHAMLTGEDVNQTEVLTAVQKADMSFRLMMQVRNKLLEAYQQLAQMQI